VTAPHDSIRDDINVLPALRELLTQHPETNSSNPEKLAGLLRMLRYLPYRPHVFAVEAALEVLPLDGEVAA
jgi:hypothetical protein